MISENNRQAKADAEMSSGTKSFRDFLLYPFVEFKEFTYPPKNSILHNLCSMIQNEKKNWSPSHQDSEPMI